MSSPPVLDVMDSDSEDEVPPEPPLLEEADVEQMQNFINDHSTILSRQKRTIAAEIVVLRLIGIPLIQYSHDHAPNERSYIKLLDKILFDTGLNYTEAQVETAFKTYVNSPIRSVTKAGSDLDHALAGTTFYSILKKVAEDSVKYAGTAEDREGTLTNAKADAEALTKTNTNQDVLVDKDKKAIGSHTDKLPLLAAIVLTETIKMSEWLSIADSDLPSKPHIQSNSVATTAVVKKILASPTCASVNANLIDFAIACAHQGSSAYTHYEGSTSKDVKYNAIAETIKEHCTVRQFAMYFAKIVWNFMLDHHSPPANWARKGFTDQTKYAAFDFFNGVTHSAALPPVNGLTRQPTLEETQAHAINASLLISESREPVHSTAARYTAAIGQAGGFKRPQIGWGN